MEIKRRKDGTIVHTISVADAIGDNSTGRCRKCGAESTGVEPDARKYPCDECGAREVYGCPELVQMGEVEIDEEAE
jgi:hypothetical protein